MGNPDQDLLSFHIVNKYTVLHYAFVQDMKLNFFNEVSLAATLQPVKRCRRLKTLATQVQ